LHVVAALAVAAVHARRMMMDEYSLSGHERNTAVPLRSRTVTALLDNAHRFVSEHEWRFAGDIPSERLARADAARSDTHA
jgi:hypothetical protein